MGKLDGVFITMVASMILRVAMVVMKSQLEGRLRIMEMEGRGTINSGAIVATGISFTAVNSRGTWCCSLLRYRWIYYGASPKPTVIYKYPWKIARFGVYIHNEFMNEPLQTSESRYGFQL